MRSYGFIALNMIGGIVSSVMLGMAMFRGDKIYTILFAVFMWGFFISADLGFIKNQINKLEE